MAKDRAEDFTSAYSADRTEHIDSQAFAESTGNPIHKVEQSLLLAGYAEASRHQFFKVVLSD